MTSATLRYDEQVDQLWKMFQDKGRQVAPSDGQRYPENLGLAFQAWLPWGHTGIVVVHRFIPAPTLAKWCNHIFRTLTVDITLTAYTAKDLLAIQRECHPPIPGVGGKPDYYDPKGFGRPVGLFL